VRVESSAFNHLVPFALEMRKQSEEMRQQDKTPPLNSEKIIDLY